VAGAASPIETARIAKTMSNRCISLSPFTCRSCNFPDLEPLPVKVQARRRPSASAEERLVPVELPK